jgi:hypothetical protein
MRSLLPPPYEYYTDTCVLFRGRKSLAFAMGLHERLGANSTVRILNAECVDLILGKPEEKAASGEQETESDEDKQ